MEKSPSEIVKLTERISKDPKSKLFVPLAEEYKKIGDNEMAIHVLSEGLKQNPTYITARSLLGRLLFETGDLSAAQREFEEVVKAMPDNLLAHKKLGDVYVRQNKKGEAVQQYKAVLNLSAGDKSVAALINELEGQLRGGVASELKAEAKVSAAAPSDASARGKSVAAPAAPQPPSTSPSVLEGSEQAPAAATEPGIAAPPAQEHKPEAPEPVPADFAEPSTPPLPTQPEKPAATDVIAPLSQDLSTVFQTEEPEEVVDFEQLEEETSVSKEEPFAEPARELHAEKPSQAVEPGEPDIDREAAPADASIVRTGAAQPGDEIVAAEDLDLFAESPAQQETSRSDEPLPPAGSDEGASTKSEEMDQPQHLESKPADEQSDDFTTDTLAELYIAQGFYDKAIDIYSRMITEHPESIGLKKKLERVKAMAAVSGDTSVEATPAQVHVPAVPRTAFKPEEPAARDKGFTEPLDELSMAPMEHAEKAAAPHQEKPEAAAPAEEEELTIDAEILLGPADLETEPHAEGVAAEQEKEMETASAGRDRATHDVFLAKQDEVPEDVKPAYQEFEPKEYVPPDASFKFKHPVTASQAAAPSVTSKKETIDRLEKWLNTIMKEK